jgi:hypothetical protein
MNVCEHESVQERRLNSEVFAALPALLKGRGGRTIRGQHRRADWS